MNISKTVFNKNLVCLAKINSSLAYWVKVNYLKDKYYKVVEGTIKTVSIFGIQLSSRHDPRKEAENQAKGLLQKQTLYLYGVGLGYLPEYLLSCNSIKALNIKILNLSLFSLILHLRDQRVWLSDKRVTIALASSDREVYYPHFAFPPDLSLADDSSQKIKHILGYGINSHYTKNQFDVTDMSLIKRIEENFEYLEKDTDVDILFGTAKGKEAIVVGAGPSLLANISKLTSNYNLNNRPIVICVATASKVLVDAGLIPDYLIVIDKDTLLSHPLIGNFSKMLRSNLVYTPLVSPEIISAWKGDRYISYSKSPIFDKVKAIFPKSSLFSGGSVIHTAVDLAVKIGCKSVTFYGTDFSYTKDQTHAGHQDGTLPMYHNTAKPNETKSWLKNGYGEKVPTLDSFIGYLLELEGYITRHPDIKFWNSSKSGALIEGCHYKEELG